MTVKELIEELQKFPPDADVYTWNGEYAEAEEVVNVTQPDSHFYQDDNGGVLIE